MIELGLERIGREEFGDGEGGVIMGMEKFFNFFNFLFF